MVNPVDVMKLPEIRPMRYYNCLFIEQVSLNRFDTRGSKVRSA